MRILLRLLGASLLAACVDGGPQPADSATSPPEAGVCIDDDGDGFGENCDAGGDCDDTDAKQHRGCAACKLPAQGCDCDSSHRPIACFVKPTLSDAGTMMCHEGTRHCRGGQWSACESIFSYPKPAPATQTQAIIQPDGTPEPFDDCHPNQFVVHDQLDPTDASVPGNNIQIGSGGGLVLATFQPDGGVEVDSGSYQPEDCVIGVAPDQDCDGLLDAYDPYPNQPPFATANPVIFLDLPPGATGVGELNLTFNLNSADVYFLVDQSASMDDESNRLKADLTNNDFINDDSLACADIDFDKNPNNELKDLGIVGAIRCLIRDANFGVGFFRELPFVPEAHETDATVAKQQVAFRNYQDITSDVNKVITAVNKLDVQGNARWPEASTVALNSLVTGNGMYFGVDRPGMPTRSGCPAGTWGYPCFRSKAIPIVLMFTDAPMHNGPSNNSEPYAASFAINAGTTASYTSVQPTNETFGSALDLGDLTTKYLSYVGDTTGMTSNITATAMSCDHTTTPNSPDAFFKFSLSQTKTVSITTAGSDFDTALGIWSARPGTMTVLPALPNTNDTGANAYSFGNAYGKWQQASGNSSALASDYSANDLSCGAYAGSPDATFSFTLSQATRVALDTSGSSYGTVLSLFSGSPPSLSTYTSVPNTNDTVATPYAIGPINGQLKGYSGSTASGITANYAGTFLGCGAASSSPEAVYSFSLSSPTRVRISAESSALDTVLALTNNGTHIPSWSAVPSTNENEASARDIGVVDGKAFSLTGNNFGMVANYASPVAGCAAAATAPDALFRFTLNSPRTVNLDTHGSSSDTVLSLYKGVVSGSTISLATNAHEKGEVAYDIGTLNGKKQIVTGGTTTGMVADYTSTQIGCGTTSTTSPDAVFKFHLDTPTRMRFDSEGSSFNTLLSLHRATTPVLAVTALTSTPNQNEAAGSAQSMGGVTGNYVRYDGSTLSMGANVPLHDGNVCFADSAAPDAVYSFVVGTAGTYELSTAGSGFDTVLGLYPSTIAIPTAPTPVAKGAQGELRTSTSAVSVSASALDGQWLSFTGNTSSMTRDYSFTNCSANSVAKDAFYRFTLNSTRTISIDTSGSAFNTSISLWKGTTYVTCSNTNGGTTGGDVITRQLSSGTYYVGIKSVGGGTNPPSGSYKISFKDVTAGSNMLACDDNGAGAGASKLTRVLAPGTYHAVVKGKAAGSYGPYRMAVRQTELLDASNRLNCNDDITPVTNNKSRFEHDLAAGDYWVVVKGAAAGNSGAYTLTVQDVTNPPADGFLACNDNYGSVTTSSLTAALGTGTYFVMVKGRYSGSSGDYVLTVADSSLSMASTLQCDYDGGASGTSLIERDLLAGDYKVLVKGKSPSAKGAYKLAIRDLTATPFTRLGCNHMSSNDGRSYLETSLAAGTYTAVLKGDGATASGAYKLSLRDVLSLTTTDTVTACHNTALTMSLAAGTYYLGVKGRSVADSGHYQLNLGNFATTVAGTYVPPLWAQTRDALVATNARVMTVLSCQNDTAHGNDLYVFGDKKGDCSIARTQAKALATLTDALGPTSLPLVFDINKDGVGLSKTVIDGVTSLLEHLEMNIKAQVNWVPDADPGFMVLVKAVDEAGDGCTGVGALNEHLKCTLGATPRFLIEFTNPLTQPVPLNPLDPNGGYNFRAELVANNAYVVDQVPIYIIPQNVTKPGPPPPQVFPNGTYTQDIAASGCAGATVLPDWTDLSWSIDVPTGTSVSFSACGGGSPAELATCTPVLLATITGGAACSSVAECNAGDLCVSGTCRRITGTTCAANADCAASATCLSNRCVFSGQPVSVSKALGAQNLEPNLRVQIGLNGNSQSNVGPTVHEWSLGYACKSSL